MTPIMLRLTSSPESIGLGLGGDALGTKLVLALRKYLQCTGLRRHRLEMLEHHRHRRSLMHPLGLRASGDLA
jgi:hypothetical protein